jgi:hypothetical protein
LVGNEEIPNVDMLCGSLSILLQKNGTLFILEQNIVLEIVDLRLHEVTSPTDCRNEVVSAEIRVLSFCLVELNMGNPRPKDSPPP